MSSELYEKLTRLQWLLHKQQVRHWVKNGPMADATRGQGRILAFLKMKDNISTKDLAYLLGIQVSSLNELLEKLERDGYITREPFEQDERIMMVKLTEKGQEEQSPESPNFNEMFAGLNEDEQKTFGEYLDRILDALRKDSDDDDDDDDQCGRLAALRRDYFAKTREMRGGCGSHGANFRGARFSMMVRPLFFTSSWMMRGY